MDNNGKSIKYCITEQYLSGKDAGAKARNDVAEILIRHKYKPIRITVEENIQGKFRKIAAAAKTYLNWKKVAESIPEHSILLIQYPVSIYPKISKTALPGLRKMKKKGIHITFVIHDLLSLREAENNASEFEMLQLADKIIVHNKAMADYLIRKEVSERKLVELGIFDYLLEKPVPVNQACDVNRVVIAGNLSRQKAGYLSSLNEVGENTVFVLYGIHFDEGLTGPNVVYEGSWSPNEIPYKLKGGFGLVWDGDSLDECTGKLGRYLMYNDPHKASLYLVSGLPLLVWSKSALAPWVCENNIGIAIGSLREIPGKIQSLSSKEYRTMSDNVHRIAGKLSRGEMLLDALEKAFSDESFTNEMGIKL